jgi:hypothetical protein
MTLGALEIKKVRKQLGSAHKGIKPLHLTSKKESTPLSGKALAARLKGLLSREAARQLDRHIAESCEQIDD